MSFFSKLFIFSLFFILFCQLPVSVKAEGQKVYIKPDERQSTELWEGKILTAKFRAGMCFEPGGKARGVLILTHRNGKEDVYHLYGTKNGDKFDLSHSSGHYFKGSLSDQDKMEGSVKLGNGMKMSLKGSRKQNVTLKAPDCAPLF